MIRLTKWKKTINLKKEGRTTKVTLWELQIFQSKLITLLRKSGVKNDFIFAYHYFEQGSFITRGQGGYWASTSTWGINCLIKSVSEKLSIWEIIIKDCVFLLSQTSNINFQFGYKKQFTNWVLGILLRNLMR